MPFFVFFTGLFTLTFKGTFHFFLGRKFYSRVLSRIFQRVKIMVKIFRFFFNINLFKGIFSIFSCVNQIHFYVRDLLDYKLGKSYFHANFYMVFLGFF